MRAVLKTTRDKGIELRDVPIPKPQAGEVLVKVKAAAICGTDLHLYEWTDWCENVGAKNPLVLGHEFCGEVVEVGEQVKSLKPGDLVAAETHIPCGHCNMCRTGKQHICQDMKILGVHTDGCFAEFAVLPEVCAWKLPAATPPKIGAVYEPFGIAVHGVLKDHIAGLSTVVIGAGPIGILCAAVAEAAGASQVFLTDPHDYRLELAKSVTQNVKTLHAKRDDVIAVIGSETGGQGADVVLEVSGSVSGVRTAFDLAGKGGRVTLIGLPSQEVPLDLVNNVIYKEARIYGITGREMFQSWYLAERFVDKIDLERVITHVFPLEEVEQAIATVQSRMAGKVVIQVQD
jgi:threonine 3-dehydrogenase